MKVFESRVIVAQTDIDDLNHVNNVVYLQWVQDVATAHWQSLASDDMLKKYSWVVLKHEIEYIGQAFLQDELWIKTWVQHSEGVRSERHVEFYNQKTKKLLVRAKTSWCLLEAGTLRPRRIEEEILQLFH